MYEDPVGINGLHEDISGASLRGGVVIAKVEDALELARRGKLTFEVIYRTWALRLRKLCNHAAYRDDAKQLLRDLQLNVTVPMNELECPHWLDSYTGEPIKDEYDDEPVNMDDWEEEGSIEELNKALMRELNPIQQDFLERKPYDNHEDNIKFVLANWEYPGEEQEFHTEEDREYKPAHMEPEVVIDSGYPRVLKGLMKVTKRAIAEGRDHVRAVLYTIRLMLRDNTIDNLAAAFLSLEEQGLLAAEDAEKIELPYEPQDTKTLRGYINLLYEELNEARDVYDDPVFNIPELTDEEIAEIGDRMLQEYLESQPVEGDQTPLAPRTDPRTRSRWFQEGFLKGVCAGLPLKGNYTAVDAAWDNWRAKTCTEGQEAFLKSRCQGASRQQAMRAFYQVSGKYGVIAPVKPKQIKSIQPGGLLLTNKRFVSWRIACKIVAEEGFLLSPSDKVRLIDILTSKGWGLSLVEALN